MQQRYVGRTGLRVSRIGLGTMSWGRSTDQYDAAEQLRAFLDADGTLVDTAAGYSDGDAERVLGIVLAKVLGESRALERESLVLAGKVGVSRAGGSRVVDTSRRALLAGLDNTLRRIGVDHLDLWQLQAWGAPVPLDETLAACQYAVSTGRVRYVGVAHHKGWQTALAAAGFAQLGGGRLASVQAEYSLVSRGAEDELLPAASELGLGFFPAAPLGRGVLTGKYRLGARGPGRAGSTGNAAAPVALSQYLSPRRRGIVDAVCRAADGLDLTPAEVALAWVRDRPGVTAPIVGARTAQQLRTSLAVERVVLPLAIVQALDEVSQPARADA
ncbi:MAG TPA: aldo/keto reductase [Actinopolymorphaceae bacterium]|jgi:aryl-alcohol dehydrogenase-like predicted oxidoreductase